MAVPRGLEVAGVRSGAIGAVTLLPSPAPPGVDWRDSEAMKAAMANLPDDAKRTVLLIVLLAYAVGAFVGAGLAAPLAPPGPPGDGAGAPRLILARWRRGPLSPSAPPLVPPPPLPPPP